MIIIPEMFDRITITFDRVVRMVISSMIKRKIEDIHYGVALISEGVFHNMSESELDKYGISFTDDDYGHPELGNVSKAHIFNMLVQIKLKELGIDIKSRLVELGYELRFVRPIGFDLTLCTVLGLGVKKYLTKVKVAAWSQQILEAKLLPYSYRKFKMRMEKLHHVWLIPIQN